MSPPPEILMATLVRAPRERVYDAFTRAAELDAWFTTGAEVDARPGGEVIWRWVGWGPDRVTAEDRGPVLEASRPSRYVFRWRAGLGGTTVAIDFEEDPGARSSGSASTDIRTPRRAGQPSASARPAGARRSRCSSSGSSTVSGTGSAG